MATALLGTSSLNLTRRGFLSASIACALACRTGTPPSSSTPAPHASAPEIASVAPFATATAPARAAGDALPSAPAMDPAEAKFTKICKAIALDIQGLKSRVPALVAFDASNIDTCDISYSYHLSEKRLSRAGWGAGIASPEKDGLWMHLSIWDPKAQNNSQLDMQAMTAPLFLEGRRVTFLMSEGTPSVLSSEVHEILRKHGAK